MSEWLDSAIDWFNQQVEPGTFFSWDFNVRALLAILIVSVICGGVGSLVVSSKDLVGLFVLALATFGVLGFLYNDLVLTSFNRSLALARRVRVRICNTLFIVMLAAVVNLCINLVGVLLINAVLIVPAA